MQELEAMPRHAAVSQRTLERIDAILDHLERPRAESRASPRLGKALNCPLAVALLGSGLIGVLTLLWQERSAATAREVAAVQTQRETQGRLLAEFADAFPVTLSLGEHLKRAALWVAAHDPGTTTRSQDGLSFAEMRAVRDDFYNRYRDARGSDSLCAQVRAAFVSAEVQRVASGLDATMDELISLQLDSDGGLDGPSRRLAQLAAAADEGYQELISAMGEELKAIGRTPR